MPSLPPFPFKSAPEGEQPALPPVRIVRQPVFSISYPFGCAGGFAEPAILQLDQMPVMDRQPQALPDEPGGGWSYHKFLEYMKMGIAPVGSAWSGIGAATWTILIDGAPTTETITAHDGTPGPIGVELTDAIDWTLSHTVALTATYHDRPSYREFYLDASTIGIVGFGPSTNPADPNVPYVLDGYTFGCAARNPAFFPSIFWGGQDYWDPWVIAHHNVTDTNGPVDRQGNYLGLTGPWGSNVPKQYLASQNTPCVPNQSGDVYAISLIDLVNVVTYAEHTYAVATATQPLPPCVPPPGPVPVFDVTKAHKVYR